MMIAEATCEVVEADCEVCNSAHWRQQSSECAARGSVAGHAVIYLVYTPEVWLVRWLQVLGCSQRGCAALRPAPVQLQLCGRCDVIYVQNHVSEKAYQTLLNHSSFYFL